jgi:anti-anti-sigma factor
MSSLAATEISHEAGIAIAHVRGQIDISNSAQLADAMLGAVANDSRGLVIELSEVDYLDSAGIHLIFKLARQLNRRQQGLSLVVTPGSPIEHVLLVTHVPEVVGVHESLSGAISML